MKSLWTKLTSRLAAFRGASAGNVAITFALATLPVVGTVGFAVDYSHANSVKSAMQAALNSTALMLSKDAATVSSATLQTKASEYFNALFTRPEATNIQIAATYTTTGGSQVTVTGTANVPTAFLGVIGYNNIAVNGTSTTQWGSSRLRVALVLDNTGSMSSDGKMNALITSTKSLITQLQNAASSNGDVYVSVIPFSKDVNVGSANYNSNWIYWGTAAQDPGLTDNASWDAINGTCSISNYSPRSSCIAQGSCSISGNDSESSCKSDYACSNPGQNKEDKCTTKQDCSDDKYSKEDKCTAAGATWGYGTWKPGVWTKAVWTPKSHSTWTGCVKDRGDPSGPSSGNYDTNVVAPDSTNRATLYPAEQYGSCTQSVMGLSYNWSAMTSLVNSMSPSGNTNQGIGLQLGWMSLAGGGPFSVPAKDAQFEYQEIIILLTDGMNTQNRWSSSQNSIDARQQLTCTNAKAAGITVYTIQVNTGNDPTSTMLRNCASSTDKFFLLTSASQIATAFNAIGTNLTQLRVAK